MSEKTHLGRYRILGTLGQGAMGLVYDAHDERLGRRVAIKTVLKSALIDRADVEEYSRRFEQEARAAARLNHPNIVQIFDYFEEDDVAYIVMEFINGRELRKYFEDAHAFPLKESIRITCELLDALAHAHAKGIVHRDVKPANVMLDETQRAKLTDFGVARFADAVMGEKSRAGTMVGTPNYMSPEQILDHPVGPKADVFAVGIILYELLTGTRPFSGRGAFEAQQRIITVDPAAPSQLNSSIPRVFDGILARALAKNPGLRLDAATFRAELIAALRSLSDDETRFTPMPRRSGSDPMPSGSLTPGGAVDTEAERVLWNEVRDSHDPEELSLFLHHFPTSVRAELVKLRLNRLRGDASRSRAPFVGPDGADGGAMPAATTSAPRAAPEDPARALAEAEALEVQRHAEAEARRKAEEEEGARQRAEARRRAEDEAARQRAEAEAERRAQADAARVRAEVEARRRAEEDAARRHAEAEARREAEEAAARQRAEAEAESRRRAEEEAARQRAEAEAKLEAEARVARERAEAAAKQRAEQEATRLREQLEAKRKAEHEAARQREQLEAKQKSDETVVLPLDHGLAAGGTHAVDIAARAMGGQGAPGKAAIDDSTVILSLDALKSEIHGIASGSAANTRGPAAAGHDDVRPSAETDVPVASPQPDVQRVPATRSEPAGRTGPATDAPSSKRRPLVLAAALGMVAVLGGSWWMTSKGKPAEATRGLSGVAGSSAGSESGTRRPAEDDAARRRGETEAGQSAEQAAAHERAEADAKRKSADDAARQSAEAQARRKAEVPASQPGGEVDAKRKVEPSASQQSGEVEAKRRAEEDAARQRAEIDAQRKADEEIARRSAEGAAKQPAEPGSSPAVGGAEGSRPALDDTGHQRVRATEKRTARTDAPRQHPKVAKRRSDSPETTKSGSAESAPGAADEEARRRMQAGAKIRTDN